MKLICTLIVILAIQAQALAQTPFPCDNTAYQTKGSNTNVELFNYNLSTGAQTKLVSFNNLANCLAFNPTDNMLWICITNAPIATTPAQLTRIDAAGVLTAMTVPNLSTAIGVNPTAGGVTANGYYVINRSSAPTNTDYIVIDINPARSTYLQMVDPSAGYAVAAAPYYKTANAAMPFSDMAYNTADGLFYGVDNTGRIATLNIVTGVYTTGNAVVETATATAIGSGTYGSAYIDVTGRLYAITNSGKSYKITIPSGAAVLLSSMGVTSTNTDGASCPTSTVVPVSLTSFDAIAAGRQVNVYWKTESEISTSHFDVERSTDKVSFEKAGTIAAGAQSTGSAYVFPDRNPLGGKSYYRLKIIDNDGSFVYSNVAEVKIKGTAINVSGASPNPFIDKVEITVETVQPEALKITVSDMKGRAVRSFNVNIGGGSRKIAVADLVSLSAGTYTLTVSTQKDVLTQKIIKH